MTRIRNPKDIELLKRPFGTLIADKDVTQQKIAYILEASKKVISVGDATTERLVSFGITPDVAVIDGKERRSKRNYTSKYYARELHCSNPSGTISKDAVVVLQNALNLQPPVRVFVEGEEDMLALPIFLMAPIDSIVLYGQPLEGLVVVKITAAKQIEAKDLMNRICADPVQ
jgi:uncharacterized protein (UPF0218 family)